MPFYVKERLKATSTKCRRERIIMKIPKHIKLLGFNYQVLEQEDLSEGSQAVGQTWLARQTILIEKKLCQEQKECTLIHEVIEALNYQLELEIPHKTISALETGIYSFLKENNLLK